MDAKNFLNPLFFVLFVSGCAWTTESIDLNYSTKPNIEIVSGAKKVSVKVDVRDYRVDKSKIGNKRNGYGKETAPILVNQKIENLFCHAIEQELIARGFQINSNAQVQVEAFINQFYNDFKSTGSSVASLSMTILVDTPSKIKLYSKNIKTQGVESDIQLMSPENATLALNKALKNGINSLFEDKTFINSLISGYSEIKSSESRNNLDDVSKKLKKLKELKDLGIITNSEFEVKRKSLVEQF